MAQASPRAVTDLQCRGGVASGGRVIGRRETERRRACECCSCFVERGETVFVVELRSGRRLLVCSLCAGRL